METIKCKECGKELFKKAEICPNCGYRIKKESLLKQLGIVFLGIIIFIAIILLISMIKNRIAKHENDKVKDQNSKVRDQYAGEWELKGDIEQYYIREINETLKVKTKIILDQKMTIKKENVGGIGRDTKNVPTVLLSELYNDKVGITFLDETGQCIILCFKLQKENVLEQISCKNVGKDTLNPNFYSNNGGVNEKLNITYIK